jgi:Uma2 family endonuclease
MSITELPEPPVQTDTLADLLDRLGGISPARVRLHPPPGTATEADLLKLDRNRTGLLELVDGVLVEKPVGLPESIVANIIACALTIFVRPRALGVVLGSDGMMKLFPGIIRLPDVSFIAFDRFPQGKVTREAAPRIAPNLAVEVLSPGNTHAEIDRKRKEYFKAGAQLVWVVNLNTRSVEVHTSIEDSFIVPTHGTLDGAPALPGFELRVAELFTELDRVGP